MREDSGWWNRGTVWLNKMVSNPNKEYRCHQTHRIQLAKTVKETEREKARYQEFRSVGEVVEARLSACISGDSEVGNRVGMIRCVRRYSEEC